MKKYFRILSILLVTCLMLFSLIIPASAAIPPQLYGDINGDYVIDILDVTAIQRYIARIEYLRTHIEKADVDGDAKITVMDATTIQRYVAKAITEFPAGSYTYVDKNFYGVTADYDCDSAIAQYPVTFTAYGYMAPGPATAYLYVDEVLVAQTSQPREDHGGLYDLTYTFEKAGTYEVRVTLTDKWGATDSANMGTGYTATYTVQEAPADTSTPVITSIHTDSNFNSTPTFTVNTKFGTEPYKYKYTLYDYGFSNGNLKQIFSTDFIDSNQLRFSDAVNGNAYLNYYTGYTLVVEVRDALGNTAEDIYEFRIEAYAPA